MKNCRPGKGYLAAVVAAVSAADSCSGGSCSGSRLLANAFGVSAADGSGGIPRKLSGLQTRPCNERSRRAHSNLVNATQGKWFAQGKLIP